MFAGRDFRSAETGVGGAERIRHLHVTTRAHHRRRGCRRVHWRLRLRPPQLRSLHGRRDGFGRRAQPLLLPTASVARSLTKGLLVACGSGAGDAAAGSGSGVGGAAGAGEFAAGAVSGVGSVFCGVGSAFCGVGALGISGFASGSK